MTEVFNYRTGAIVFRTRSVRLARLATWPTWTFGRWRWIPMRLRRAVLPLWDYGPPDPNPELGSRTRCLIGSRFVGK